MNRFYLPLFEGKIDDSREESYMIEFNIDGYITCKISNDLKSIGMSKGDFFLRYKDVFINECSEEEVFFNLLSILGFIYGPDIMRPNIFESILLYLKDDEEDYYQSAFTNLYQVLSKSVSQKRRNLHEYIQPPFVLWKNIYGTPTK